MSTILSLPKGFESGRLSVVGDASPGVTKKGERFSRVLVRCRCGETKILRTSVVRGGHVRSCGCLQREKAAELGRASKTHGMTDSRAYHSWCAMRARCENPKNKDFHSYGGRGIKVCERWGSFENFLADMGEPPVGLTLDRIKTDGHYHPGNCRWANSFTQAFGIRTTIHVSIGGSIVSLSEAARRVRRNASVVWSLAKRTQLPFQTCIDFLATDGMSIRGRGRHGDLAPPRQWLDAYEAAGSASTKAP
jgi:hypothetical protein